MKLPLSWLREWVQIAADWDARELARRLTLAGFEVEAIAAGGARRSAASWWRGSSAPSRIRRPRSCRSAA